MLAVLLSISYVWFRVMTTEPHGDEGYLMITMRGFLDGHVLYDEIYTQYGPTYYLLRAPLYLWLSVPLGHDSTRILCALAWMTTASLCAWGVWRATRSWLLMWLVFLQVVVHVTPIANEPGHPQELVAVMLAAIFCLLIRAPASRRAWCLAALLLALLTTVKINVGVFVALGLMLCWLATTRQLEPWARACVVVFVAAVPFLLMRRHLGEFWALAYATSSATAIGTSATFILTRKTRWSVEPRNEFIRILLVGGGTTMLVLGVTLVTGVSWEALVQGLILDPLRFPEQHSHAIKSDPWAIWSAVLSVLAAAGVSRGLAVFPSWRSGLATLKLLYGVLGSVCLVTLPLAQLLYLAPWLWIAVISMESDEVKQRPTPATPLLCSLACFQLLQAYPVAGSQLAWATLLLVPTYALCLHEAIAYFLSMQRLPAKLRVGNTAAVRARLPGRNLLEVFGLVALIWAFSTWSMDLPALRKRYFEAIPLNLPGSNLHRSSLVQVQLYRSLASYLKENSDAFITYRGFHNLHFWSEVSPPSQLNPTLWDLVSDEQQIAVAEALGRFSHPKIILERDYLSYWRRQDIDSLRPLPRFIVMNYDAVGMIGPCVLLAPMSEPADNQDVAAPR